MWDVTQAKRGMNKDEKFLLTHPVWDVTSAARILPCSLQFLLTHPVWDVTINSFSIGSVSIISTHTSRVGCDQGLTRKSVKQGGFLLTHPVWDVTNEYHKIRGGYFIFLLTHPVWDVTKNCF